ncbi:hypothetical protein EV175_006789 [Coemansia sp. RSA 1933]|nr:hypothetical protein EV175_006789 [Coemansia sp. RSA 1933]
MAAVHRPSDKVLFILFGLLTSVLAMIIVITSFIFVRRRRSQERSVLEQRIEFLRQQRDALVAIENERQNQSCLSADQIKALPRRRYAVADNKAEQLEVQQTCGICLADYSDKAIVIDLPCKHFFHEHCAITWLCIKNTCPFCNYEPCAPEEPVKGEP